MKIMFKNKVLFIAGGTGSFGNAVLSRFLGTDIKEIRVNNQGDSFVLFCTKFFLHISVY